MKYLRKGYYMNRKGQSLVLFIIILPVMLVLFSVLIETVYISYQKQKLYSVTKTIIASSLERNDKNDIINLYKDNNIVLESIDISNDLGISIKAKEKVNSLMGKIINKENYTIYVDIMGFKKDGKMIYQRG